eukprot:m.948715 g.948715  ORF g.948715 m.948715 type:complete len:83 (+) comp23851_c2_seq13:2250-2498(+)
MHSSFSRHCSVRSDQPATMGTCTQPTTSGVRADGCRSELQHLTAELRVKCLYYNLTPTRATMAIVLRLVLSERHVFEANVRG